MDKLRVRYSKTGKAKYISHLDLMTVMQRSFIRAGVSLKYSEGFNPHPHLSVALPASVGIDSLCELMDVALRGGGIQDGLDDCLPEGLKIQSVYRAQRSFNEIKWIGISCRLVYGGKLPPDYSEITEILTGRLTADKLIITKKTKRGISAFDAAPNIKDVHVSHDEAGIYFAAKISAQNPTISHKDIVSIIGNTDNILIPDYIEMKRIEIFDANMVLFK